MSMVLDTRPDLFSKSTGHNGGVKVKLEPLALDCAVEGAIPPISPALAVPVLKKATGACSALVGLGLSLPPPPLDVLASQPGMKADTSSLGQLEEVKRAWKAGGLSNK